MCDQAEDVDIWLIAAARGALDAGVWSSVVTLAACAAGWWLAFGWSGAAWERVYLALVSTVTGLGALWFSVRMAIDRRLFAELAAHARSTSERLPLAALDRALIEVGWIESAKAGRTLAMRVHGAKRLFRNSLFVAAFQWLMVGAAILAR